MSAMKTRLAKLEAQHAPPTKTFAQLLQDAAAAPAPRELWQPTIEGATAYANDEAHPPILREIARRELVCLRGAK